MKSDKKGKYGAMAEKALEKHKMMGVPAVFMKGGKMVCLMPDGQVVKNVKDWKKAGK